jgi:tRNA (guanine-N7-)-methyltransferase
MAQRFNDPFSDPRIRLNTRPEVNPFLDKMIDSAHDRSLPIRYGTMLRGMADQWRESFGSADAGHTTKLILEIGSHLGKNLIEFASSFPHDRFIGADITFKRVVTTAKKISAANLGNAQSLLMNGQHIDLVFARGELDGIVVFFPDPWTKKRTAKHRLLTENFARKALNVLKPEGFLWLKTDQKPYFDAAVAGCLAAGFVESRIPDPLAIYSRPFESTFERKFRLDGLTTYQAIFLRPETTTPEF